MLKSAQKSLPRAAALRRRAEARAGRRPAATVVLPASEAEALRLIHELRVHQIELEMQNEELVAAREKLESLSRRQVAVQEEERGLLATELYDCTSANLAALDLLLRSLAQRLPPHTTVEGDALADIQALLRDTAQGIRTICTDLRPAVLDYAGIVPALESYARSYPESHGIKVAVSVEAPGPPRRLAAEIESTLFRLVQEALSLCARHTRAAHVHVKLDCRRDRVVLEIGDDGVSLVENRSEGVAAALTTMRERSEFTGGHFSVAARPGGGNRIRAAWSSS